MSMFGDVIGRKQSGIIHIIHRRGDERINSGTGFLVQDLLVTNNHVIQAPSDCMVQLRTFRHDPMDPTDGIYLSQKDFLDTLLVGSPAEEWDYAVLDVSPLKDLKLANFEFGTRTPMRLGEEVGFMGFPFDHFNLTCHVGRISSFRQSGPVPVIQLDATVNQGNSGGPLFGLSDGGVIGIVTRKVSGLTSKFDQLLQEFSDAEEALQTQLAAPFGFRQRMGSVDLTQLNADTMSNLNRLARELLRSSNTGIAYAFSVTQLSTEAPFHRE